MRAWWLPVVVLGGCDLIRGVTDAVDGVTNPTVAIGLVVRAEAVGDALEELDAETYQAGHAATVFLADARGVSDLENAPITGASMEVAGCDAVVALQESASGTYTVTPSTPLDGCTDASLTLRRTDTEPAFSAPITVPDAPDASVPSTWTAGEGMTLDLAGLGYGAALVVVADATSGEITFSNEPTGALEAYRFFTATDEVGAVEIPGSAFREDAVHAVLVTGLVRTPNAEVTEANTALTVVMGGRTRAWPVSTLTLPDTGLLDTDAADTDGADTDPGA